MSLVGALGCLRTSAGINPVNRSGFFSSLLIVYLGHPLSDNPNQDDFSTMLSEASPSLLDLCWDAPLFSAGEESFSQTVALRSAFVMRLAALGTPLTG